VREEIVEGCIEEAGIEMELLRVFVAKGHIGIDDTDQLCVALFRELIQETDDVAVFKADNSDADRSGLSKDLRSGET
jgi:hypothetical protein